MTPASTRGTALVRNLLLLKELEDLLEALGPVKPVLLKGAALLAMDCADPRRRVMQDIDLLVRPEELDKLIAALKKQGFVKLAGNASQFRKNGLDIDAHAGIWYLNERELALFHERAQDAAVGEQAARVPAPDDHLIFLLTHAAVQHGEIEPKWVEDVALLISRRGAEIDFSDVWARLTAWGLAPAAAWFFKRSGIKFPGIIPENNSFYDLILDKLPAPNKGHLLQLLFARNWRFRFKYLKTAFFPDSSFLILRYDLKSPAAVFFWRLLRPGLMLWSLALGLIYSAFAIPRFGARSFVRAVNKNHSF